MVSLYFLKQNQMKIMRPRIDIAPETNHDAGDWHTHAQEHYFRLHAVIIFTRTFAGDQTFAGTQLSKLNVMANTSTQIL